VAAAPGARGLRARRRPWSSRPPPWLAGRTREPCAAATELAGLARAATEEVVKLPYYLTTTSAPTQPLLGTHDGSGVARGSPAGGGGGGARDPHTRRDSMARSSRAGRCRHGHAEEGPDRRSRRGRRRRSPRALALSPCTAAPGRRREGGGARQDGGGQPRARGEARRRREERRAGRRLAGGGRAAWRPVARGRGRRARGVEAGGSQRQARAVCGSPAFYPSRM